MNFIVAVDQNWGIGKDNDLLYRIPEDMKYFKQVTTGKIVVMGEATYHSMPGGKALPNRINIVLSDNPDFSAEDAIVVRTMENLFAVLAGYNTDDIFVIGGASVYNQLMDKCHYAYITKINDSRDADKYINSLDGRPGWKLTEKSPIHKYENLEFVFAKYKNNNAE